MDDLDRLIEQATTDTDETPSEPVSPTPDVSPEDTGEPAVLDEVDVGPADDVSGVVDDDSPEVPDPEPDVTPSAPTPAPVTAQPAQTEAQLAAARQQLINQQHQIFLFQQEQQRRAAEEHVEALRKRWSEMPEDQAHAAEIEFLSDQYNLQLQQERAAREQLVTQRQQEEIERREAEAKPKAIAKAIELYKLKPEDAALLNTAIDGDQLDQLATYLQTSRAAQTKAARETRAAQIRENPSLRAGAGGSPTAAAVTDPKNLDDFIDQLLDGVLAS